MARRQSLYVLGINLGTRAMRGIPRQTGRGSSASHVRLLRGLMETLECRENAVFKW